MLVKWIRVTMFGIRQSRVYTYHCRPALTSVLPEMVDPDGCRSMPRCVNSGTQPSSMLKMLSLMAASTTCAPPCSAKVWDMARIGGNLNVGRHCL